MVTVEIRSADGGLDAEMFAGELTSALSRALSRDGITHTVEGTTLSLKGAPAWL